ncbi:hypothetical protein RKD37_000219 [Streptomyces ambofaciens]
MGFRPRNPSPPEASCACLPVGRQRVQFCPALPVRQTPPAPPGARYPMAAPEPGPAGPAHPRPPSQRPPVCPARSRIRHRNHDGPPRGNTPRAGPASKVPSNHATGRIGIRHMYTQRSRRASGSPGRRILRGSHGLGGRPQGGQPGRRAWGACAPAPTADPTWPPTAAEPVRFRRLMRRPTPPRRTPRSATGPARRRVRCGRSVTRQTLLPSLGSGPWTVERNTASPKATNAGPLHVVGIGVAPAASHAAS